MTDPAPDLADPAAFVHWATDTIRFSDQDAVGHVNNVAVAAYVETGRLAFSRQAMAAAAVGAGGFVLARLVVDYRRQFHYPGEVRVGTRLLRLGTSSLTVGHGVFKGGECVATAEGVLVHLRNGRSAPLDGTVREDLERLLPA